MSILKPKDSATKPESLSIRRIMVTTDFSSQSSKTYTAAARLAIRFKAKIQLVHFGSKRAPEYSGITNAGHLKSLRNSLAQEAKHAAFADQEVGTCILDRRDIGRSLNENQDDVGYDLIITNTLSRQGFHRHFDHQLAEKIVARSTVPVLLFGPAAFDTGIDEPKSVLVPFDFLDKAEAAFPVLRLLAEQYEISIKFLYAQSFRFPWLQKLIGGSKRKLEAFELKFERLTDQELPNVDTELEIYQGLPEGQFSHRAYNSDADLIVIGTYGRLGNLSKSMIRLAKCPVLGIPTDRPTEN